MDPEQLDLSDPYLRLAYRVVMAAEKAAEREKEVEAA